MDGGNIVQSVGHSRFLVSAHYASDFIPSWFDPGSWGERAIPVASGGRGSAWFLKRECGSGFVLRRYRRGGLAAKVSGATYLFLGEPRVRSVAEFLLLQHLYSRGFPVPEPVAASYHRHHGIGYSASILVNELPSARPFAECMGTAPARLWRSLGAMIRRFHEAGVHHADLNCYNILISNSRLYLIDFDRGRLESANSRWRWKEKNLARLHRSIIKVAGAHPVWLSARWSDLLAGYNEPDNDCLEINE